MYAHKTLAEYFGCQRLPERAMTRLGKPPPEKTERWRENLRKIEVGVVTRRRLLAGRLMNCVFGRTSLNAFGCYGQLALGDTNEKG